MCKPITKKQHYVPQFYLKRFTDKNGDLHVYNNKTKKIKKATPKAICYTDFLYETEFNFPLNDKKHIQENSIEKELSRKEDKYSVLLEDIINVLDSNSKVNLNTLILNSAQKEGLRKFITNMLIRNPATYIKDYKITTDVETLKAVGQENNIEFWKGLNNSNAISHISHSIKSDSFDENSKTGEASFVLGKLEKMHFTIYSAKSSEFITSSRPVRFETVDNFLEIIFPLSPKYLVRFTDDILYRKITNRLVPFEKEKVEFMNLYQIFNDVDTCEFLISRNKDVLSKLLKERIPYDQL